VHLTFALYLWLIGLVSWNRQKRFLAHRFSELEQTKKFLAHRFSDFQTCNDRIVAYHFDASQ